MVVNSLSLASVDHLRNLCFRASSQLIRLPGTQSSILDIKSAACLISSFYIHDMIVSNLNGNFCGTYLIARIVDNFSEVSLLDVVKLVNLIDSGLVHRC